LAAQELGRDNGTLVARATTAEGALQEQRAALELERGARVAADGAVDPSTP
jgi:hypothetical protein